ncbi:hypothetical protein ACEW7V_00340 [Areca yellow leaf disease phytoplasma]|uniref:hypothetical protein n=1 Tax=Areca yellow leaf disease phytoplasma TaxID=927614 RepID=UPI0035B5518E
MPSSKIAMFNDVIDYHLNSNVEQGFSFELSQLDEIKEVELTLFVIVLQILPF